MRTCLPTPSTRPLARKIVAEKLLGRRNRVRQRADVARILRNRHAENTLAHFRQRRCPARSRLRCLESICANGQGRLKRDHPSKTGTTELLGRDGSRSRG